MKYRIRYREMNIICILVLKQALEWFIEILLQIQELIEKLLKLINPNANLIFTLNKMYMQNNSTTALRIRNKDNVPKDFKNYVWNLLLPIYSRIQYSVARIQ